jgi:hypothetical protein
MSKNHGTTILRNAPEPPSYLAGRILRRIEKEERQKTFRQMAVSGALLAVSRLSQSGFLSFASLFGSDFSFAAANLRELFLSLEESFPAVSAAFCVASIVFVLWFGMRLANEAGVVRRNRFATR